MESQVEGIIRENKQLLAAYKEAKRSDRTREPRVARDMAVFARLALDRMIDGSHTERDGSDPRSHLTLQQLRLVKRIARGHDVATAMTRLGVHPERGRRWLMTPRFQRAVLRERVLPATPQEQEAWSATSEGEES